MNEKNILIYYKTLSRMACPNGNIWTPIKTKCPFSKVKRISGYDLFPSEHKLDHHFLKVIERDKIITYVNSDNLKYFKIVDFYNEMLKKPVFDTKN